MSLKTNIETGFLRVATEFKTIRTLITGTATGDLSGLTTIDKSSIIAAINEASSAGGAASLSELTDVAVTTPATGHVLRHNGSEFVNVDPTTYLQPLDGDLTSIAALTTTAFGRGLLALANSAALAGQVGNATSTQAGAVELATDAEAVTGTDTGRAVTPANLTAALANYQPTDGDLGAIAALTTTSYGRAFLTLADQAALMALVGSATDTVAGKVELATAAETATGTDAVRAVTPVGLKPLLDAKAATSSLSAVATSGNAADLTGTLGTAQLPALAIVTVQVVADQAARLALNNVQPGDVAKQTDTGTTWMLAAAPPSTAGNWVELEANGDVLSVAGRTGAVVLTKTDVGLSAVDNTADADKPVSSAQATAIGSKQPLDATLTALAALTVSANTLVYATGADAFTTTTLTAAARDLLDDVDVAAMRDTLEVYSQVEIGDVDFNFADAFAAGLE